MDFTRLEKNIFDVVKEEQVKLGYRRETIRLFYPLMTLNRFLDTRLNTAQMSEAMDEFAGSEAGKLGRIEVSVSGTNSTAGQEPGENTRFCFCLFPEVSEYIHNHSEKEGFLYDFIGLISRHDVSMDDVIGLFGRYSDHVHVEKADHGEFDYLVYFEDGVPDDFRYCLTNEGCHVIYHRYTKEDYEDLASGL